MKQTNKEIQDIFNKKEHHIFEDKSTEEESTKSEEFQSIYRMHSPTIKTEFGNRSMTEVGVIKGLELEKNANYILIPQKHKDKNTSWCVHKIKKSCNVEVETWSNLEN